MKRLVAASGVQYFKQTAAIDLSGQSWTPFDFGGHFDGNGKTISHVTIDMPSRDNVGFFSQLLSGGELKNVGLENVNVKGNAYVGGLARVADRSSISHSYASGTVTGTSTVGGLIGYADKSSISNSYYDRDTAKQLDDTGKEIPRTTDEMKKGIPTLSTVPRPIYVDWNTSIWDFGDDSDYPTLRK